MKLILSDNTISNPTLPLRWCLEENDLGWIKEQLQKDLYLLIALARGNYKYTESRYLIPLDQLMEYLVFDHPGEWKISAIVLLGKLSDLSNSYLRKTGGLYATDIFDYGYENFLMPYDWRDCGFKKDSVISTSLRVDIPKDVFAKEPPEWEKKWVNRYFTEKPYNQCAYRKRRIFAYTLQVPYFLMSLPFLILFKIITAVGKIISNFYEKSILKTWQVKIAQKTLAEKQTAEARKKAALDVELERRFQEYADIACNGNLTVTLEALPKRKRTIYLRYEDLKMKVCKPFAR